MQFLVNFLFGLLGPSIMIFLCGSWTIIPSSPKESFSKQKELILSIIWFMVGILFMFLFSTALGGMIEVYKVCKQFSTSCLTVPVSELHVSLILGYFVSLIIYSLGVILALYIKKNKLLFKEQVNQS